MSSLSSPRMHVARQTLRLILTGPADSGKTTLVLRVFSGENDGDFKKDTLERRVGPEEALYSMSMTVSNMPYQLNILDGRMDSVLMNRKLWTDLDLLLLMYHGPRTEIDAFADKIEAMGLTQKDPVVIIIAPKCDLMDTDTVEGARQFAISRGWLFRPVSAYHGRPQALEFFRYCIEQYQERKDRKKTQLHPQIVSEGEYDGRDVAVSQSPDTKPNTWAQMLSWTLRPLRNARTTTIS